MDSVKDGWMDRTVKDGTPHFILARRSQRGRSLRIAYGDVRVKPGDGLTQELLSCSLEERLGYDTTNSVMDTPRRTLSQDDKECELITTTKNMSDGHRDIGQYADLTNSEESRNITLKSDSMQLMEGIYEEVRAQQVTRLKFSLAIPWKVDKAFNKEYHSN